MSWCCETQRRPLWRHCNVPCGRQPSFYPLYHIFNTGDLATQGARWSVAIVLTQFPKNIQLLQLQGLQNLANNYQMDTYNVRNSFTVMWPMMDHIWSVCHMSKRNIVSIAVKAYIIFVVLQQTNIPKSCACVKQYTQEYIKQYSIMMLMEFSDLSQSDRSNLVMWQVKDPCPRPGWDGCLTREKVTFIKSIKNFDYIAVYFIASLKSRWKKINK